MYALLDMMSSKTPASKRRPVVETDEAILGLTTSKKATSKRPQIDDIECATSYALIDHTLMANYDPVDPSSTSHTSNLFQATESTD